jgi:uncharacterized membrane protein YeaQ/YmgE (transglycosylase-associated protein family)
VLGTILGVIASAFVTGALARLAVPGPDPMPAWLTVVIGLAGSVAGGLIAIAAFGRNPYAASTCAFVAAVLLVVAYRRYVQRRAIWGRDALRFPRRGIGVEEYRKRLERVGIDPDRLPFEPPTQPAPDGARSTPAPDQHEAALTPEARTDALRRLAEERDAGAITAEQYRERRHRIVYGDD